MKEIVASKGHWLTQATLQNEEERGFWKRLYPAFSLSEADFTEWTDEQKEHWEQQHLTEFIEE